MLFEVVWSKKLGHPKVPSKCCWISQKISWKCTKPDVFLIQAWMPGWVRRLGRYSNIRSGPGKNWYSIFWRKPTFNGLTTKGKSSPETIDFPMIHTGFSCICFHLNNQFTPVFNLCDLSVLDTYYIILHCICMRNYIMYVLILDHSCRYPRHICLLYICTYIYISIHTLQTKYIYIYTHVYIYMQ